VALGVAGVPAEGPPDGVGVVVVVVGSALARLETPIAAPRAVTATAAETTNAFFDLATYRFLLLGSALRRCLVGDRGFARRLAGFWQQAGKNL
jgi:hypothetical protein